MNHSFEEIAKVLAEADSVLLYPHINMDGDALGSCAAICRALRLAGKQAWVLVEEKVPLNLRFLDRGYCTEDKDILQDVDISFCVDSGDISRFANRKDKFLEGKTTICIDHHPTSQPFCDYNHIAPEAAATGELVYQLLKAMGTPADAEIGEAIFAAITTDTGNFQYSNTRKESFAIMAELCDWGIDTNRVSVEIYENARPERKRIVSKALNTLELIGDGKGAIAHVTLDMLAETGALPEETESVVEELRSIAGVEYAAFLKEKEPGIVRVSLRAKRVGDVSVIAQRLGGGGHVKAAGGTIHGTMEEALDIVRNELKQTIESI